MDGRIAVIVALLTLAVVSPSALARRTTRHLGSYRSPSPSGGGGSSPVFTPPSGSSPTVTPPYSSSSPGSGSSPVVLGPVASPLSSPVIGSPISSPTIGSPSSSPVVGPPIVASPSSSPLVGSPLVSPVIETPPPPSGDYGGSQGGRGSCDHWRNSGSKWPGFLSAISSIARIFGGRSTSIFGSRMTLMQALLNSNQDEYSSLARQGTASLLNAYTFSNFAYTPEQVRELFSNALESPDLARQQAQSFEQANLSV